MSNEHTKHKQCQTCFVDFSTNEELTDHIEAHRFEESLLVAKLERCRRHLPPIDHADDEIRDSEDSNHEPFARFQCPDPRCEQKVFTTRSNVVRHYREHVPCYETCIYCQEVFTRVDRFTRHDCRDRSDESKDIYTQRRVRQLLSKVTEELNRLQSPPSHIPSHNKGRAQEVTAATAQKKVKTTHTLLSLADSMASEGKSTSHCEPLQSTAANNTDGTDAEAAEMRPSIHTFHLERTNDTLVNDSRWIPTETAPPMSANDNQWPFSDTLPLMDSGWAFTTMEPAITESNEWAFALPTIPANGWPNDGQWSAPGG
ncbi:uncharacterized protein RAG0_14789 [Rhynchosporium agropyri]|uniref:C2H2-type domain-containing protein n=1 Tax=Rhynchosporium agropyri TaxID=914238 RepID=A0A1E1LID2_9HELO|nr:uncharacterized protein RAG0_14789 [Rhynchosporium agropyri]